MSQAREKIIATAQFTTGGSGSTGLTIKAQVYRIDFDGTVTRVVTDGTASEVGLGFYSYVVSGSVADRDAAYQVVFTEAGGTADLDEVDGGISLLGEANMVTVAPSVRHKSA